MSDEGKEFSSNPRIGLALEDDSAELDCRGLLFLPLELGESLFREASVCSPAFESRFFSDSPEYGDSCNFLATSMLLGAASSSSLEINSR